MPFWPIAMAAGKVAGAVGKMLTKRGGTGGGESTPASQGQAPPAPTPPPLFASSPAENKSQNTQRMKSVYGYPRSW